MTNPEIDALLSDASWLERTGRLDEAQTAYKQLLVRSPDHPESWYNLARLQRRSGQFDAALASYDQALARGISQPEEVHLNRGVIYSDVLRRDAEAERELNAALRLNPNYVPAMLNLANLHEDRGQRNEAQALYEKALSQDANCWLALARLAGLATTKNPDDPLAARLREALARPEVTPADRATLGFALGKLLDQCGAYEAAFDAYSRANQDSRASSGRRVLYDRERQAQFFTEVIETFASKEPTAVPTGKPPIFICGLFRSGSTLAEQILASHPQITSGGELSLLPALIRSDLSPYPAAVKGAGVEKLNAIAGRYLGQVSALFPNARRVTDKRPDNFVNIGMIKRLFPEAKIIHTQRNALDNCLSLYFLHLDHGMGYALDLMDTGHFYGQYQRLMAHWKSLYGSDILDFDYDALVREPRPAIERLLSFCDLPWDDRCLEFYSAPGAVKTASVWQVRRPIYRSSSGRAENYARQLAPLKAYLDTLS